MKLTKKDWEPLFAAAARHSLSAIDMATETYYLIEKMANGEPQPLNTLAKLVRIELAQAGFAYSVGRLEDYYRTAAWVMDNTEGKMGWIDYRTFEHHERARRRENWSYPRLLAEEPMPKVQGLEPGTRWSTIIRRVTTELRHGHELVGVDAKFTQGGRKKILTSIEDGTGEAIEVLIRVGKDMDKL
jgi:hypothetical protein